jgi:hypothetical protein
VPRHLILYPVLGMVVLTIGVWLALYRARIGEMREKRIRPQVLASRASAAQLTRTGPADNFSNLFEVPVLFYVLAVLLYAADNVGMLYLVLAWAFVALRVAHSVIHITYNRVIHRFLVYVAGASVVWVMWAVFAVELFAGHIQ